MNVDGVYRNPVVKCNWRRLWNEDRNSAAAKAVDFRLSDVDR